LKDKLEAIYSTADLLLDSTDPQWKTVFVQLVGQINGDVGDIDWKNAAHELLESWITDGQDSESEAVRQAPVLEYEPRSLAVDTRVMAAATTIYDLLRLPLNREAGYFLSWIAVDEAMVRDYPQYAEDEIANRRATVCGLLLAIARAKPGQFGYEREAGGRTEKGLRRLTQGGYYYSPERYIRWANEQAAAQRRNRIEGEQVAEDESVEIEE
jgi:hypothetical protein